MQVGVKYCGGCNPRYDRGALVRAIQAALPQVSFSPVQPGVVYDLLLVISGCHVACADTEGIQYRLAHIGVNAAGQLEETIEKIKTYLN